MTTETKKRNRRTTLKPGADSDKLLIKRAEGTFIQPDKSDFEQGDKVLVTVIDDESINVTVHENGEDYSEVWFKRPRSLRARSKAAQQQVETPALQEQPAEEEFDEDLDAILNGNS